MIFPILRGILLPTLAPATWFFLVLNLFVFTVTNRAQSDAQSKFNILMEDKEFVRTQGAAFAQFVRSPAQEKRPTGQSQVTRKLAEQSSKGDTDARLMLGRLAAYNHDFLTSALSFQFDGDEVALKSWREEFKLMRKIQHLNPSNFWGLSADHQGWMHWITYQFTHSGFLHLFWNMTFLLIFGCWLEATVGASFVVLGYIGAGIAGAHAFAAMNGVGSSPLIGASAAISGLIALTAVIAWRERCRFLYWWLLPGRDYSGYFMLPAWTLLILYTLPDLGGLLASVPEFTGIAFSAHLGGTLFGVAMGVAFHLGLLVKEEEEPEAT